MRGRLIFPFVAELHRLDTVAMAPDYDEDFKEPVLVDTDDDGVGEPFRREHPPVRVPCQVEPEAFEALRMATSGNTPRSSVDEFRTQLAGKDDVRAFTCGFVVRGFDVDEGLPLDLGKRVTEPELLPAQAIATGGSP